MKNLITGWSSLNKQTQMLERQGNILKYIENHTCVTFTTNNNRPLIDLENEFYNLNKTI